MSYERTTRQRVRRIPLPFLKRNVGAGDVVAGATNAVGIEPCEPCEARKRWLNARLGFRPLRRR